MSTYDTTNTADRARNAADRVAGSMYDATNTTTGRVAQGISEANERTGSAEPMNSSMRTMLLSAAGLSILGSLAMQFMGRKHEALFVGQWAPTLLIVALWYQEVKDARRVVGSRQTTSEYGGI